MAAAPTTAAPPETPSSTLVSSEEAGATGIGALAGGGTGVREGGDPDHNRVVNGAGSRAHGNEVIGAPMSARRFEGSPEHPGEPGPSRGGTPAAGA